MPQMSPMNWLNISWMIVLMTLFIIMQKEKENTMSYNKKTNKTNNWKW